MRHIVICGLPGYTICFSRFQGTIFGKKVIEHKMGFGFLNSAAKNTMIARKTGTSNGFYFIVNTTKYFSNLTIII
jgi:hypothetical protein